MPRLNVLLALIAMLTGALSQAVGVTHAESPRNGNPFQYYYLTEGGDTFLNYDGSKNFERNDRDWPVGLVFYRNASVNRVKDYYRDSAFSGFGGSKFLGTDSRPNSGADGRRALDRDRGRKPRCGSRESNGRQEHFRIYGGNRDRLYDREYGYYVVATAHYDHGDFYVSGTSRPENCPGRTFFGFSENVEQRIVGLAEGRGASVRRNFFGLGNVEPRRDEGNHIWKNDGRASIIRMP